MAAKKPATLDVVSTAKLLGLGEVDVKPAAEDERFHSVTTIIGALDKPALMYWAAEQTAELAVSVARSLPHRVEEEGHDAVVKWLRDARFRPPKGRKSASELGTAVHDACEKYAITGIRPEVDDPEVEPFLDRFDEWAQKWQPEYLAAEAAVYNLKYRYAGTLDAIAIIDGATVLLDYKSSRKSLDSQGKPTKPYPEVGLQLAAYQNAEIMAVWRARRFESYRRRYYLLSPDEKVEGIEMPKVDGAMALHLTPEHADLYPIDTSDKVFESFLYTIEIFRWTNTTQKGVVGPALTKGN